MKFLIVEPQYEGHYLILYIKFLIRVLTQKKHQIIILTTKKASRHDSFSIIKKENPNIKIHYFNYSKPRIYLSFFLLLSQIKLYFTLKKSFKTIYNKYQLDHVFVNSLDHYDKAISIFGSPFKDIKFSGIYVNPKFHLKKIGIGSAGRFNFISKFLFLKFLQIPKLNTIFTNDFFFIKYLRNSKLLNKKKISFLFEPREFQKKYKRNEARKILKLPLDTTQILVYGALKESKGIRQLLKILTNTKIKKTIKVILAGHQDQQVKNFLSSDFCNNLIRKNKLIIFNGFQNDKMESLIFSAVDLIWVGYQKNFPFLSGVLYQAAVMHKPIIASNHGIINWMNKKYNLGYSVDIEDEELLIKKINLLCDRNIYKKFSRNSRFLAQKANPRFFMGQIYKDLTN